MDNYWEESTSLNNQVKIETNLTFSGAGNSEDEEYGFAGKKKLARDPLSHRIIEKRRRDRMNSCLADLSRLIPHEYMKKGRGRIEKTEVIEMAIRRIKHLMSHTNCKDSECGQEKKEDEPPNDHLATSYRLGFVECLSETIHFLVQVEGLMATDPFCSQLKSHLSNHCDNILQSEGLRSRLGHSEESGKSEQMDATHVETENQTVQFPCTLQDTGSDTSTGHINNLSPTSSNSDKGQSIDVVASYKFKNRIQKRFERGATRVDKSSRVPVFVLAPSGAHYLATWLEAASIPGYVDLNASPEPPTNHHPVTISVDFRSKVGTS